MHTTQNSLADTLQACRHNWAELARTHNRPGTHVGTRAAGRRTRDLCRSRQLMASQAGVRSHAYCCSMCQVHTAEHLPTRGLFCLVGTGRLLVNAHPMHSDMHSDRTNMCGVLTAAGLHIHSLTKNRNIMSTTRASRTQKGAKIH